MARKLVYDLFHWLDNTLYGDNEVRGDEIRGGDGFDTLFGLDGDDLLFGRQRQRSPVRRPGQ